MDLSVIEKDHAFNESEVLKVLEDGRRHNSVEWKIAGSFINAQRKRVTNINF